MPMPIEAPHPGPLSHIRVLDLTSHLAGPYATQILGDLGALVIKLEQPGDISSSPTTDRTVDTIANFASIDRNKQSIVVDLESPEGLMVAKDLADECDILIENLGVATMKRLGLSYEDLEPGRPGLIYCSLSCSGQTDGVETSDVPVADLSTGMYGVIGVLAALARRTETGRGDHIELTMPDVQATLQHYGAPAEPAVPQEDGVDPASDPIKLRHGGRIEHTDAPQIGADARAIMDEVLGYDDQRIETLIETGVVQEKSLAKTGK